MIITTPKRNHKDRRGEIKDILVKERIDYVTLITCRKGSTRGNHYHKKTVQMAYVLDGKVKVLTQMPGKPVKATVVRSGSMIVNEALERHAIVALEDTTLLVLTRGLRGGKDYETDTFRLAEPLHE
jgi:quercetin dioxygenase-like cupin family protein